MRNSLFTNHQLLFTNPGFTLIEVLVAVGIIGILTSIGVSSYNSFNAKKQVESVAEELKTNLRLVQSKAVNNEKDSSVCSSTPLDGWVADFSSNSYYGQCGIPTFGSKTLVDLDVDDDGTDDISLSWNGAILFKVLGGTDLASDITITVSDGVPARNVEVTVSTSGEIE